MTGTLTTLLAKSKVRGTVDGIFVSSRAAQVLGEDNFTQLFRSTEDGAAKVGKVLVAVETAKHLVPLKKDVQVALCAKEEELAAKIGLKRITGMPGPLFILSCNARSQSHLPTIRYNSSFYLPLLFVFFPLF